MERNTYTRSAKSKTEAYEVRLGKKMIGTINVCEGGYQYTPKGYKAGSSWSGEVFTSLTACKRSLDYPTDGA
jgi:hypothetical protein